MAFDPIQEDCLRLILQSMRREGIFPLDDASFIEHGMEQFRTDPSKLITCDADRSFHLMAKATEILDYRLPFLTDEVQVDRQEMQARKLPARGRRPRCEQLGRAPHARCAGQ